MTAIPTQMVADLPHWGCETDQAVTIAVHHCITPDQRHRILFRATCKCGHVTDIALSVAKSRELIARASAAVLICQKSEPAPAP